MKPLSASCDVAGLVVVAFADGERVFQSSEEGAAGRASEPRPGGPGAVWPLADRGVSAPHRSGWKGSWEGRGLVLKDVVCVELWALFFQKLHVSDVRSVSNIWILD